ncbi:MAG: hypothetical protein ABI611_11820, partial [Solirubrobacteraceae bacterium]
DDGRPNTHSTQPNGALLAICPGNSRGALSGVRARICLRVGRILGVCTAPPTAKPGRYQPTDRILAFLEAL